MASPTVLSLLLMSFFSQLSRSQLEWSGSCAGGFLLLYLMSMIDGSNKFLWKMPLSEPILRRVTKQLDLGSQILTRLVLRGQQRLKIWLRLMNYEAKSMSRSTMMDCDVYQFQNTKVFCTFQQGESSASIKFQFFRFGPPGAYYYQHNSQLQIGRNYVDTVEILRSERKRVIACERLIALCGC